jgi:microcystin-dependent protein
MTRTNWLRRAFLDRTPGIAECFERRHGVDMKVLRVCNLPCWVPVAQDQYELLQISQVKWARSVTKQSSDLPVPNCACPPTTSYATSTAVGLPSHFCVPHNRKWFVLCVVGLLRRAS